VIPSDGAVESTSQGSHSSLGQSVYCTVTRLQRRWDDNIRMDVREVGWEGVAWMHLTEDRDQWWVLQNTVMNLLLD